MPRPKASPQLRTRAYKLWGGGYGHKAICEKLEEEFEESVVSERTVGTWISEFKLKQGQSEGLSVDASFQWHLMKEYELPWQAGEYLLDMWVARLRDALNYSWTPEITFRAVRWWWKVHLAAPELSAIEVRSLATGFEIREVMHDILNEPLMMKDLDAFLAFRPWSSAEKRMVYLAAIEQGLIPELSISNRYALDEREQLSQEEFFAGVVDGDFELG